MTNHPNRSRGPYIAKIGGSSWAQGPEAALPTIRGCRAWAEGYGTTADWCTITDAKGRVVGEYRRDTGGTGTRWFRATV